MRIEIEDGIRTEYPDEGKYLHDEAPDWTRQFINDFVILGKESEPWAECSEAEMLQWKADHPDPQPEE